MFGVAALLCCSVAAQNKPGLVLPDTVAAPRDSTALPLVTSVADSTVKSPDSTRAQDIHPQDSPVDRGFLIRTSDGSAELRIRGSVRLNGIFDFKGLQNQSTFSTYEIPVGEANSDATRFQMNAGQTRLGLEANRKAGFGDIFVKVETDFLGTSNILRLRHGYAAVYGFLFSSLVDVCRHHSASPDCGPRWPEWFCQRKDCADPIFQQVRGPPHLGRFGRIAKPRDYESRYDHDTISLSEFSRRDRQGEAVG